MADAITIKALQDASLDAKSLEEVVNGNEVKQVTTRKGETYPSVKKAINTMFENGGLPATPFTTKALMESSELVDGDYAQVTDDTVVNNGLYLKTAGVWTKSAYDPKGYTDDLVAPLYGALNLDRYAEVQGYNGNNGVWIRNNERYLGLVFKISKDKKYEVTASSEADTHVAVIESSNLGDVPNLVIALGREHLRTTITKGSTQIIEPQGMDYMWVSVFDGTWDRKPVKVVEQDSILLRDSNISEALTVVGGDLVPSTSTVLKLSQKVQGVANAFDLPYDTEFKPLDITLHRGRYIQSGYNASNGDAHGRNDGTEYSAFLTVSQGDVLEFDYRPIFGCNLAERLSDGSKIFPLVVHNTQNSEVTYSCRYVAKYDTSIIVAGLVANTLTKNGVLVKSEEFERQRVTSLYSYVRMNNLSNQDDLYPNKGHTGYFRVSKGDVIKIVDCVKGLPSVLMQSPVLPESEYLVAYSVPENYPDSTIEWTATEDAFVLLNGYPDSTKFYIKRAASLENFKRVNGMNSSELGELNLPEKETVFATHKNFILKMEDIDGVEHIAISDNLGESYSYIENTMYGDGVTNYHFFTDGTILISTEKKVYWTDDYLTLNESTLLNEDGSPFVAGTNAHHFFGQQNSDRPMFIDGVEVYAWGDYVIANTTPSVWFTVDYGRTIKRALKARGSTVSGEVLTGRHIHKVYHHRHLGRFLVAMGDHGDEVALLEGVLNPHEGTWEWSILGRDIFFKFGMMWEDEYYTYFTTDYTEASQKNDWGILRVGHNHIGDRSKYRLEYKAPSDIWNVGSPFRFIADGNGNKILMPELLGLPYITLATEGYNFKKLNIRPSSILSFIIGPNNNGDIYCKADFFGRGLGINAGQFLTGGTINLTKTLRNAGLHSFMRGEQNQKHMKTVAE